MLDTKVCSKCKERKPLSEFNNRKDSPDGHRAECKACKNKVGAQYHEKHKAERIAKHAQWQRENRDSVNNKNRKWYHAHPEKTKVRSEKWHKENPDKVKAKSLKYRQNHPEEHAARRQRWKDENPERWRAIQSNRRARLLAAPGSFTGDEWYAICKQQNGCCLACGKKAKLTVDHIVPLAKGGTNDKSNIQGLCSSCNSRKGTQEIDYRGINGIARWIQRKLFD